jgi:hypothetical protein
MLRHFQVLLIVLLTLGFTAPVLHSQEISHARIVRISYLEGTVQLNSDNASMNSPIRQGDMLRTGTDGLAEVQFEDGSIIRMASETQITFAQLARLSSGEAITRADLDEGEAEFLIPASSAGQFAVNARSKNLQFKTAGRYRVLSTASNPLEVAVWKGEVIVRDRESGKEITVKKNETLTVNPADPGQYDLEPTLVADDLDEWSDMRDQTLSAAASTSYSNQGTYSSALYPAYYEPYYLGGGGCYGFGWFPGNCWNSPIFYPWFFPPIIVVQPVPVVPRRPPHPRPPTVIAGVPGPVAPQVGSRLHFPPSVSESGPVPVKPGARSLRFDQGTQRVFNDENFRRTSARVGNPAANEPVKAGEPAHAVEPLVAPGRHSPAGSASVSHGTPVQPTVATATPSANAPAHTASHSSAPSAPARTYSPPASSGSHASSGSAPSHSSPPSSSSSHSGGGGKH